MENLFNQTFLTVLGLVFGLLGIIISVLVTIKTRIRIEPRLYFENIREVSKLSDSNREIAVQYKGRIVNQVTTSRIWFWNNGRKPLKREDIPISDPIRIRITESDESEVPLSILDFSVVKISKDTLNVKMLRSENSDTVIFDLEYLDWGDGIVIEIQHTGSQKAKVNLDGVILGPKGKTKILSGYSSGVYITDQKTRKKQLINRLSPPIIAMVVIIIATGIISYFIPPKIQSGQDNFRETFPPIIQSQGVDSIHAITITELAIKSYAQKEPLMEMSFLFLGIIMFLIFIIYIIERKRYPKCLRV